MRKIKQRTGKFINPKEFQEISKIKLRLDEHRIYSQSLMIEDGDVPPNLAAELINISLELVQKVDRLARNHGFLINVDIDFQNGEFIIYEEENSNESVS